MYICLWKMNSGEFKLGMIARRCCAVAQVRILRPDRKTDLDLCEEHFNKFVEIWGLSNLRVKFLCPKEDALPAPLIPDPKMVIDWNKANGIDWDDV